MSYGAVVLIVLSAWSLLSIVASVVFGGMTQGRDNVLFQPHRSATNALSHQQHPIHRAS